MKLGGLHSLSRQLPAIGNSHNSIMPVGHRVMVGFNRAKHPKQNLGERALVAFALRFAFFTRNGHRSLLRKGKSNYLMCIPGLKR